MTIVIENSKNAINRAKFPFFGCRFKSALLAAGVCAMALLPFTVEVGHADTLERIQPKRQMAAPSGAAGLCTRYSWACAKSTRGTKISASQIASVKKINRRINQSVRSVPDQRQYRSKDVWALPTRAGGDCEDFALAKKLKLMQMGYAPSELLIATVMHKRLGPHAVLVMRTEQGDYVLDNLTNKVLPWQDTDYFFVQMQNPSNPRQWVGVFLG